MMKHRWTLGAFVFALFVGAQVTMAQTQTRVAAKADEASCECQQSTCGSCEVETGTSFYTAKCGPGNARVKSCKKPTCEPVENQKQCLAELSMGQGAGVQVASPEPVKSQTPQVSEGPSREPASVGAAAGQVEDVIGVARVIRAKGGVEVARKKLSVFEGDTLDTSEGGRLKVVLKDSSEMILPPQGKLVVEKVRVKDQREILLNLLKGKVRNQVVKDYSSPENTFQVKTRTAVAGVRGTIFVTSFEERGKEWITQVHTFDGVVKLAGQGVDINHPGDEGAVKVTAGTKAAFVVDAPADPKNESAVSTAIESGKLLPIFKMTPEESSGLEEETRFQGPLAEGATAVARVPAASGDGDEICVEPKGKFNQCSWTCEGNPKSEKKCRTDLPGVSCVRRLCRANGQWGDPQRMPASQMDLCTPRKPIVSECGSYW